MCTVPWVRKGFGPRGWPRGQAGTIDVVQVRDALPVSSVVRFLVAALGVCPVPALALPLTLNRLQIQLLPRPGRWDAARIAGGTA